MKRFIKSWPMLYWSRKHTLVLFVAMLAAVATMMIMTSFVGG